jgi:hypothetical protein
MAIARFGFEPKRSNSSKNDESNDSDSCNSDDSENSASKNIKNKVDWKNNKNKFADNHKWVSDYFEEKE